MEVLNMDISELIKEAKPLYFKRKKRRRLIKQIATGMTACLFLGVFMMQEPSIPTSSSVNDLYAFLYNDEVFDSQFNMLTALDTSLPMDEYEEIAVLL